jgi:WD40 repeat protein
MQQLAKVEHMKGANVTLSPDGRLLASKKDARLFIDRLSQKVGFFGGRKMERIIANDLPPAHAYGSAHVQFSQDGQMVASLGADLRIEVMDLSDKRSGSTCDARGFHPRNIRSLRFSSDNRFLTAVVDGSSVVPVWRTHDGVAHAMVQRHTKPVTAVAFSPDSQTLASASEDGTIRLSPIS